MPFFNIMLIVCGTVSVHKCVYSLFELCFICSHTNINTKSFDFKIFSLSQIFGIDKYAREMKSNVKNSAVLRRKVARSSFCRTRLLLISTITFFGSAALCLTWYFMRDHPYAFILLNFINCCLCIHAISISVCRSLRVFFFGIAVYLK